MIIELKFRSATISDFDIVMDLMADVFEDISDETIEIYRKSYHKALDNHNIEQFIVTMDDEIIGHVTLTLYHSFYDKGNIMWIDDLAVNRDKRRHGYGSKIMEFCLDYANQYKVVEVFIGANQENLAAQKLYEKFIPKTDAIFYIKKLRTHGI